MRIAQMTGLAPIAPLAGPAWRAADGRRSRDRDTQPELRLDAARGVVLGLGLSLTAWTALGLLVLSLC
jgi:hypothetical protein